VSPSGTCLVYARWITHGSGPTVPGSSVSGPFLTGSTGADSPAFAALSPSSVSAESRFQLIGRAGLESRFANFRLSLFGL